MDIDYQYLSKIKRSVALVTSKKTSNILDGDFRSIHRGRGLDFDDFKEYQPGDDVRDIDWKSSSRTGALLVRRYMTERKHHVLFIGDTGDKMRGDTRAGESKKELALMLFGTIAYIGSKNGADFTMAYPRDSLSRLGLFNSGEKHLEELAHVYHNAIDNPPSTKNVDAILRDIVLHTRKQMIIFVVTDFEGLSHLSEKTLRLASAHNDIFILTIEDALLTDDNSYNMDSSRYVPFFMRHSKKLRELEISQRDDIEKHAKELCIKNRVSLTSIARQRDIIDTLSTIFEKRRHNDFS